MHYLNMSLNDIEGEEWRDIPIYEGMYQVSNYGRIKGLKRYSLRYNRYGTDILWTKEKIKKQTLCKYGKEKALQVTIKINGIANAHWVSTLVGMAFFGYKENGFVYQHKDKNPLNNKVENIEMVTYTVSMKNDTSKKLRTWHNKKNFEPFMQPKFKIIREDGLIFTFSMVMQQNQVITLLTLPLQI